jgi:hypothetical protein
MGLNKKAEAAVIGTPAQAAIDRLKQTVANVEAKGRAEAALPKAQYKQRDFDAEARGKTRCVQFEAALMSPAIAGMQFNTMEEYLKLVKQAADAGVAYSFQE